MQVLIKACRLDKKIRKKQCRWQVFSKIDKRAVHNTAILIGKKSTQKIKRVACLLGTSEYSKVSE